MEKFIALLKEEKMSWGSFILIVSLSLMGMAWADSQYVTKDDLSAKIESVAEQIRQLKKANEEYIEEERLGNATQAVYDAKRDYVIAKLSGASQHQLDAIDEEIERAEAYKQCLIKRGSNCKHLLR